MHNYRPYIVPIPSKGVFRDLRLREVPPEGFARLDNFHYVDGLIVKHRGWEDWDVTFTPPAESWIFGQDLQLDNLDRRLLLGTKENLYHWPHFGAVSAALNATSYTGADTDRWQIAQVLGNWYLTNRVDGVQLYNGTTMVDLSATADASLPASAMAIASLRNHLVLGNVLIGAYRFPRRVCVSDIENPLVWLDTDTNEATFEELPVELGQIVRIEPLGTASLIVYGTECIYEIRYVGLPNVIEFERRVAGEGLLGAHSLASVENIHYFLGKRDFYAYDGGNVLRPLGRGRVISAFFAEFDQTTTENIYSFVHPVLPEIYFVYQSKDATTDFDKVLVYDRMQDAWSTRSAFNHTFMTPYLSSTERTIADATNAIQDAVGTWRDKQGKGVWRILSGN